MTRSHFIAALIAILALTGTSLAVARDHDGERRGKRGREREEQVERREEQVERREKPRIRISLDQAVSMAERRFNARVVRTDTRESGDRLVYVLRLLNEAGRVWTVKVDAASGRMD
jgi:uncharacterized membrane protein YkoI